MSHRSCSRLPDRKSIRSGRFAKGRWWHIDNASLLPRHSKGRNAKDLRCIPPKRMVPSMFAPQDLTHIARSSMAQHNHGWRGYMIERAIYRTTSRRILECQTERRQPICRLEPTTRLGDKAWNLRVILTSILGRLFAPVGTFSIFLNVKRPSTTLPNTTCFPSRKGHG